MKYSPTDRLMRLLIADYSYVQRSAQEDFITLGHENPANAHLTFYEDGTVEIGQAVIEPDDHASFDAFMRTVRPWLG